MYKLTALLRRVSDTALIALTTSILGTLIFCWYLWWYIPLGISIAALEKQTISLRKRITSIEKRMDSSLWVPQELEELERELSLQASQLTGETETLKGVLTSIKQSGAHLLSWKPGERVSHDAIQVRKIACECEGSYEQLSALLDSVACNDLVLTKTPQGVHCMAVFEVASRRVI